MTTDNAKPSPHGERQRFESISALVSTPTAEARTKSRAALSDESGLVRHEAAFVLGCIGQAEDVDSLLPALSDPSSFVRHEAALALGRLGSLEHIPALTAGLDDQVPEVAMSFEMAIAEIEERAESPHGEAEGLALCPFCGGVAILKRVASDFQETGHYWWVGCEIRGQKELIGCGIGRSSLTSEAAIARWNTRATIPAEGAADICAEMAREAAMQAAKCRSELDDSYDAETASVAAQFTAESKALREAERRIRAAAGESSET